MIGRNHGRSYEDRFPGFLGSCLHLKMGWPSFVSMTACSAQRPCELETLPGVQIHGITDRNRLEERVLTVSFTWEGHHPRDIARALGDQGISVWDGNYDALGVTERLGLESRGGMVRIGAVHYSTLKEVHKLGMAL